MVNLLRSRYDHLQALKSWHNSCVTRCFSHKSISWSLGRGRYDIASYRLLLEERNVLLPFEYIKSFWIEMRDLAKRASGFTIRSAP